MAKDFVRVGEGVIKWLRTLSEWGKGVIKWLRTLSEWEEKGEEVAMDAYFLP